MTNAPMSHPSVQEYLRDAKYTSYMHAKATLEQGFKLRARISTDKGTACIPFKESALTQYGRIWSLKDIPDPTLPNVESSAHASSSVNLDPNTVLQQQQEHNQYAKGKRPLEGGGRGQALKAPKIDSSTDRKKGKGKPSSASFFPRFREYYYPIVNPGEAQYLYELYEHKFLPKKDIQLTNTNFYRKVRNRFGGSTY